MSTIDTDAMGLEAYMEEHSQSMTSMLKSMAIDELEHLKKRMGEDIRMDSIFRSGKNLTEKFDNRTYLHPHGMTDFDYKSIPDYRKNEFEKLKVKTRFENYQYLGEHYELDALMAIFLRKLFMATPQDTVHFAAEFFTKDTATVDFQDMLELEKRCLSQYRVKKLKEAEKITMIDTDELVEIKQGRHYQRCPKKPNIVKSVKQPEPVEIKPEPKKHYCGCKDRKLAKKVPTLQEIPVEPQPESTEDDNENAMQMDGSDSPEVDSDNKVRKNIMKMNEVSLRKLKHGITSGIQSNIQMI